MKIKHLLLIIPLFFACQSEQKQEGSLNSALPDERIKISLEEAGRLVQLPIGCIDIEYPNKLNQVIGDSSYLESPSALHPAFYGCFDWHSSVHGHWSLVRIARLYPEIEEHDRIVDGLKRHLTATNIEKEIAYFDDEYAQGYERMYGWAWLLKLGEELHRWDHPEANSLFENLKPLLELISQKTVDFLPKLQYPIRVGTHTNTAFALSMMYDYALEVENEDLRWAIEKRGRDYFMEDANCPLSWEPSGYDFLSPCLEEADLMRKLLDAEEFDNWLSEFLPDMQHADFELAPGIVSDRTDGHLVHLDGLNYSRAWCLFGIARANPDKYGHLIAIANAHIEHSLPDLVDENYEGGHWLASFALLALSAD